MDRLPTVTCNARNTTRTFGHSYMYVTGMPMDPTVGSICPYAPSVMVVSLPPENVLRESDTFCTLPYTSEPSMKAVMVLIGVR